MTEKAPQSTPILGDRYQLQQSLATGGMAYVYKAWDLRLERYVAVKVLRQDFSKDSAFRESFRQEARAAANLSHPNIVTVHDFGFDQDRLYIVMELIPGTDLKTLMKHRKQFTLDEAIPLLVQACNGVGYAHRAGLVHCDIKPHNMLVSPDYRLKVTDFGIARAIAASQPEEKSDIVWGSPQYFSPEQASGEAPSPASDVYSLGVILYEMLTGRLPFISDNPTELAQMHREIFPLPPRQINPMIPPHLEQILMKVLSKEPSARYRSADQLGRILANFSSQAQQYSSLVPPTATSISTPNTLPTISSPASFPVPSQPLRQDNYNHQAQFQSASLSPMASPITANPEADAVPTQEFDWATISLSLLTVLAAGGLIPFWLYIWFTLNPPR